MRIPSIGVDEWCGTPSLSTAHGWQGEPCTLVGGRAWVVCSVGARRLFAHSSSLVARLKACKMAPLGTHFANVVVEGRRVPYGQLAISGQHHQTSTLRPPRHPYHTKRRTTRRAGARGRSVGSMMGIATASPVFPPPWLG